MTSIHRRALMLAAGAAVIAPAFPASAAPDDSLTVPVGDRQVTISLWRPAEIRGAVLFGHGLGGQPGAYDRLLTFWKENGWLVLAPLHVDSQAHPRRADYTVQAGFPTRIADMAAASAVASRIAPGKPKAAGGHSYGSLFAAVQGGALAAMANARDPDVKAIVQYSTPGRIPGLVGLDAFAAVAAPSLTVTGTADTVPGFVADWRDHLALFETAPAGGRTALVFDGGGHFLIGGQAQPGPQFERAARAGADFLAAEALGDGEARARLAALASADGLDVRRR